MPAFTPIGADALDSLPFCNHGKCLQNFEQTMLVNGLFIVAHTYLQFLLLVLLLLCWSTLEVVLLEVLLLVLLE